MSNSALVTYTQLSPNCTHPRSHAIDTITIHCIVGQFTAQQGCALFQSPDRQASCNYVVGRDGSIGLCVDEGDRSWCTGGNLTANGITGKLNDHRAVTIEVASDKTHPYAVTDAAYEALIRLVADIAKRNGMGTLKWRGDKSLVGKPEEQNMTVHRWFAKKACPGDYLYERMGDIAQRANEINEGEVDMTKDEVTELVRETVEEAVKPLDEALTKALTPTTYDTVDACPAWAQKAVRWAVDSGYIKGDEQGRLGLDATKLWALQVTYNIMHKDEA